MSRWVILADDLTGAADAAVAFAGTAETSVHIDGEQPWPTRHILAVNAESRHLSPKAAADRTARATRTAAGLPDTRIFKKIDSQLRGNVAVEIAAMLTTLRENRDTPLAVIAPAYPANGRTLIGGRLVLDGIPEADGPPSLEALLRAATVRALPIPIGAYSGAASLADLLGRARSDGTSAVIVDAESEAQLAVVAEALELAADFAIPVGSGGLAAHLAARELGERTAGATIEPTEAGILFVIGSFSDRARAQLRELVAGGVRHVTLDHIRPSSPDTRAELLSALGRGHAVLSPDLDVEVDDGRAEDVAEALAAHSSAGSTTSPLVIVGGATLHAVLRRLGVHELRVEGELGRGIVVSRDAESGRLIITKAGAFGDERALVDILTLLSPSARP